MSLGMGRRYVYYAFSEEGYWRVADYDDLLSRRRLEILLGVCWVVLKERKLSKGGSRLETKLGLSNNENELLYCTGVH